jgi:Prokaryotic phospholipase A2
MRVSSLRCHTHIAILLLAGFSLVALTGLVPGAGAHGAPRGASPKVGTDKQLRYGIETMNLSYMDFLARKADFMGEGCTYGAGGCRKPWPYNEFDWTDNGCSPSFVPKFIYRNLFDGPCQQHDFGYRNFGNGLQLGRTDEKRAWIDKRFLAEMRRLCSERFSSSWRILKEKACLRMANIAYAAVRSRFGRAAFYRPPPFPEPGEPGLPDRRRGLLSRDRLVSPRWG